MSSGKYVFNEETLQYEKAKLSLTQRLIRFFAIGCGVAVAFTAAFFILSKYITTPEEAELQREVQQMSLVFDDLSGQMGEMSLVLENIQERDASIHRTMFGMTPIDEAMWNGGTGGHDKYKHIIPYDRSGEMLKDISKKADALQLKLALQSMSLDTLESLADNREDRLMSIPSIKPVRSDKLKRHMNLLSGFGRRIHPIDKIPKMHYGIDFTAPRGTPIHASGKGTVRKVVSGKSGYGKYVIIDHGYGYETLYAHMHQIKVEKGQEVTKGEVIGTVGSTGRSTAPHCHYEIRLNGTPVNPIYFCHDGLTPEEYEELVRKASVSNQSFD